jgi:hypothetical protein
LPLTEFGTSTGVEPGSVPFAETVAHLRSGAGERVVGNPAVGQVFWDVVAAVFGESPFDRPHLLAVSGFLPIIAVIRQKRVALEPAAMQRQRRTFVIANAHRQHVADQEIRVSALGRRQRGEGFCQV